MPEKFNELFGARNKVGDFESSRALAWERRHFEEKIGAKGGKLRKADAVTLDEYIAAQKVLAECRRLLEITFGDFDVLLVPSAPGEAPKGLTTTGDSVFNQIWTALHTPAVTVPVFTGPAGLPMGAQFVGPVRRGLQDAGLRGVGVSGVERISTRSESNRQDAKAYRTECRWQFTDLPGSDPRRMMDFFTHPLRR